MKPPHEEDHFKRSGFGAMRKSCALAFPTGPSWGHFHIFSLWMGQRLCVLFTKLTHGEGVWVGTLEFEINSWVLGKE